MLRRPGRDAPRCPAGTAAAARRDKVRSDLAELPRDELARLILTLEEEMREAAADLRFEYAAKLRDEINDLKGELKEAGRSPSCSDVARDPTGRTVCSVVDWFAGT